VFSKCPEKSTWRGSGFDRFQNIATLSWGRSREPRAGEIRRMAVAQARSHDKSPAGRQA
jgi:hypothetical protein